ncbi:hypothetical protein ACTQ6A_12485 [Lachnospiraceae bacterium LCP25S3_G4]
MGGIETFAANLYKEIADEGGYQTDIIDINLEAMSQGVIPIVTDTSGFSG